MKSPFPPADGPAWNEPERDSHAPFPVPRWQATCLPRITISLSFANSEFTFANILRLNSYDLPVGQAVYAIDAFPDGRSALAYRMDRRRWLQYERSQRAPDRCLFGAAPQRREEPAQRTSAFLSSREESGEDRCWSAWSGRSFNLAVEALQIYFFDDRCYIRGVRFHVLKSRSGDRAVGEKSTC